MNRFVFLVHTRADRESLARPFATELAKREFKIVMSEIPPRRPIQNEAPWLFEPYIRRGLLQCCFGTIIVSPELLSLPWNDLEAAVGLTYDVDDRLFGILKGVTDTELWRRARPLARLTNVSGDDLSLAASMIADKIPEDVEDDARARDAVGLAANIVNCLGCPNCEARPALIVECITAPPMGSRGMLVCPRCGCGYAIRERVPQLLPESATYPDIPAPPLY
jgi:uncharacterized protein YbaR (Trm112 family)